MPRLFCGRYWLKSNRSETTVFIIQIYEIAVVQRYIVFGSKDEIQSSVELSVYQYLYGWRDSTDLFPGRN